MSCGAEPGPADRTYNHSTHDVNIEMMIAENILNSSVAVTLAILLSVAVITDLTSHRIPNFLLLPALVLALFLHTSSSGMGGLLTSCGGLVLGLAMLLPLYATGGMGAADVKLLGVVGALLGPWGAVVAGLATMMAGAVFGATFIAWRRVRPYLEIHVANMLSAHGSGADLHRLPRSIDERDRVTRIPYAPAIAAGTLAALWYIGYLPMQHLVQG